MFVFHVSHLEDYALTIKVYSAMWAHIWSYYWCLWPYGSKFMIHTIRFLVTKIRVPKR